MVQPSNLAVDALFRPRRPARPPDVWFDEDVGNL